MMTEHDHKDIHPEDETEASESESVEDAETEAPQASAIIPYESSEEERAAARKRMESWPEIDEPYPISITSQLADVTPRYGSPEVQDACIEETLLEYKAMKPSDPLGSSLSRVAIGLRNGTMASLGRATAADGHPALQGKDLKLGLEGARTLAEIVKLIDARESRQVQNLTVGQVNVGYGGQAIVGQVNQPKGDGSSGAAKAETSNPSKDEPHTPKAEGDDEAA